MAAPDPSRVSAQSPRLVRGREAAEMLAISERKLWELMRGGQIPHVRIGASVRYDTEDVCKFIEDRRDVGRSG
jgi:excisionase family DNA binding protein